MKAFIAFAFLAVSFVVHAPAAHAQSGGQVVRDMIFSEVERRIIREHFGVGSAQQQPREDSGAPDWAVKTMDDVDDARDDDGDRGGDDEDRAKPEKDKKGKGKGNGKDKSKQMPPGLAKRDQLPPGLAKQLAEKGRLPPGIAKRDLPADLAAKLPARPDDQEVTIVDGDVVLVDKATGIILDVIRDVVTNGAGGGADATTNPDGTLAAPGPNTPNGAEDTLLDTVLKSIFGGRSN